MENIKILKKEYKYHLLSIDIFFELLELKEIDNLSDTMKLEVIKLQKQYICTVSAQLELPYQIIEANSIDKSKISAIKGAIIELIERIVLIKNKQDFLESAEVTTNGGAIGRSTEEAKLYALLEVVERDSFLNYWYSRVMPEDEIKYRELIKNGIIRSIMLEGYDIRAFYLKNPIDMPIIWLFATKEKGGFSTYSTTGIGFTGQDALNSAAKEMLYAISRYTNFNEIYYQGELSRKNGPITLSDHAAYYSIEGSKKFFSFITSKSDYVSLNLYDKYKSELNLKEIYAELMRKCIKEFGNPKEYQYDVQGSIDIKVAKLKFPDALQLFFGPDSINKIIEKRLFKKHKKYFYHPYP